MNQMEMDKYLKACDTLKVDPLCELDVAAAVYKHLMKKFHPDRPTGNVKKAQEINAAYDIFCKYRPAYTPQSTEDVYKEPVTKPFTPTNPSPATGRHHDIYADVMGFNVNVSAVYRILKARQDEVLRQKQKKQKRPW